MAFIHILIKNKYTGEVILLDRDLLIQQVKDEYARLAQLESSAHITNLSYNPMSPEAYYERALESAIRDISAGKYDDFVSGLQVVEHIATHKTQARQIQDNIESTLHKMEMTQELIDSGSTNVKTQELLAANERRAEAIPEMIREMKEQQAQEELNVDSPKVIGGGSIHKFD